MWREGLSPAQGAPLVRPRCTTRRHLILPSRLRKAMAIQAKACPVPRSGAGIQRGGEGDPRSAGARPQSTARRQPRHRPCSLSPWERVRVRVNKSPLRIRRPNNNRRLCSGDSRIAPGTGPRRPAAAGACPDPNANSPRPRFPNRPWPVQWNSGGCPAVQYHRGEAAEDCGPGGQEALLRSSPTLPDQHTIPRRQFPGNFIPALGGT